MRTSNAAWIDSRVLAMPCGGAVGTLMMSPTYSHAITGRPSFTRIVWVAGLLLTFRLLIVTDIRYVLIMTPVRSSPLGAATLPVPYWSTTSWVSFGEAQVRRDCQSAR